MNYFELRISFYLKKDIDFIDNFEILSKYISFTICDISNNKDFHTSNKFKHYSFGGFYPVEKDKVYKKGKIYTVSVRGLDEKFITTLSNDLRKNINNSYIQAINIGIKKYKQKFITELYSLTPVIVSVSQGQKNKPIYWTMQKDGDILKLQNQLQQNLLNKYKAFYNEELKPTQNFIQLLEIKNKTPQNIQLTNKNNKSYRLFGNKLSIIPDEDEISQKLAFIAMSCGLGEKNSFGGGFCLGRGLI
ncbi:MAG: CRISPR-associated endoribonuclease Cas6 [Campylobacterota bacterium]|nr:CRISPR-associated endoribonuclease Cas6 [Campylobacterota bacterium]